MSDFVFSCLKVVSLKCNGLRDTVKRKSVFIFVRRSNANIIFLQETHSCEFDVNWWRSQWGQIFYCHVSHQFAGVTILLNKFKGDIIESLRSKEGRWLFIVGKLDNTIFVLCSIYGYNSLVQAKNMSMEISHSISALMGKYQGAVLIMGVTLMIPQLILIIFLLICFLL